MIPASVMNRLKFNFKLMFFVIVNLYSFSIQFDYNIIVMIIATSFALSNDIVEQILFSWSMQ